jgi:NAD(P)-dependent dehydrogenase (short-subunit alcohol dehydrogenase family)
MREGGRVLLVSSGVCAPGNNVPGSFGYKVTKAALNQFGRALAQEIRDRGIVVVAVSPGPTDTAMLRASFTAGRTKLDPSNARPARESARAMLATVEAATVETSGSFFDADGRPYSGPDGLPPSA